MNLKKWRILDSHPVVQNRWISLRRDVCELPDGQRIDDYFVLDENDVGIVFGLTPQRELILVEQYKHGIQEMCLEIPAGFFEGRDGDPLQEARREFLEETGYDATKFRYVGKLAQSPTRMTNYFHLFIALDAYPVRKQNLDPTEDITVHVVPMNKVFEMITAGKINSVSTVASIYMAWDLVRGTDSV
jgi:8-oxo-dGTP pyrophosphatase MutT (NUDIX family)